MSFAKQVSKDWRIDLQRWETVYLLFGFLKVYKRELWGKKAKWSLFPKGNHKYLPKMPAVNWMISEEVFKAEYNSNKYLLPLNMDVKWERPA